MDSLLSNFVTAIPVNNFLNHCSKLCVTAGLLSRDQPGGHSGHLGAAQRAVPAALLPACPASWPSSLQNSQHRHGPTSLLAGLKGLWCFQNMAENFLHTSIKTLSVRSMEGRHKANSLRDKTAMPHHPYSVFCRTETGSFSDTEEKIPSSHLFQ